MLKRARYAAVTLLVIGCFFLLNLPREQVQQLKLAAGSLFLPLFGISSSGQKTVAASAQLLLPRRVLAGQIQTLQEENAQLRLELSRTEEIRKENSRLRTSLGVAEQFPWRRKLARVIGRDPANWWRTIRIDLGSRDGIRIDLPLMAAEGLVGRISEVGYGYSHAVLLGDANCRVSSLIQETRDHCILRSASGVLDPRLVDLVFLPRHAVLQPGYKVITSGEGGIFPKGIMIGELADFRPGPSELYLEARVRLAVDFSRLEEVWVVFP